MSRRVGRVSAARSFQRSNSRSAITPPGPATPVDRQYRMAVASSLRSRRAMMRANRATTSSRGRVCAHRTALAVPATTARAVSGRVRR
ncbi:hypothetical protein ACZ91_56740 [Streptomyces regensis]|nr:hypothetical protein ACZ91_56740 [Streptomyces regensis]